ncbi:MAG: pyruvate ferredoxin oxidoreductase [Sulfolobaceae archaeon]
MSYRIISGNEAVALAVKLARVKVIGVYPITPQTTIIEKLAEMKAKGELDAEIIRVESEHSAMATCYGAAVAGVRAFTATASQGLLYMHEMIWWVSGSRIPLVMVVGTRAVGAPWNIWNDHTDFMTERDSGWIMAFAMDPQEVLDLTLQAFRISENENIFLPMMVGMDGFILSHVKTKVYVPSQEEVDKYLPERRQPYVLDPEAPIGLGNMFPPLEYMKMRNSIDIGMINARELIPEIGRQYEEFFGYTRGYSTLNQSYKLDDSRYAVVLMGAWAGDAMEAIDELRRDGLKIGLYRIRYIRPWAYQEIRRELEDKDAILVLDRSVSFSRGGILYLEVSSTLRDVKQIKGIITGLGGVSINKNDIKKIILSFVEEAKKGIANNVEWYYPLEGEKIELRTPRHIE